MVETNNVVNKAIPMPELRAKGTTDFSWKYTTMVINKNNLNDFELLSNRRDIRAGKVSKITKALKQGKHFETPMVVNMRAGKMRLIDGNHRHLALERFFKEYPERTVKVAINQYDGLTDGEERAQYTKWNSGTKQTTNDFIKQYWDEVSAFKKMQIKQGFSVDLSPTWATNKLEAKLLLNAYFASHYPTTGQYGGPSMVAGPEFILKCKQLDSADLLTLNAFLLDYQAVFGIPDNTSNYYRPAVFSAMADIWFRNRAVVGDLTKRMKKIIGHKKVVEWGGVSGTLMNCQFARNDFILLMNGGATKNLLV